MSNHFVRIYPFFYKQTIGRSFWKLYLFATNRLTFRQQRRTLERWHFLRPPYYCNHHPLNICSIHPLKSHLRQKRLIRDTTSQNAGLWPMLHHKRIKNARQNLYTLGNQTISMLDGCLIDSEESNKQDRHIGYQLPLYRTTNVPRGTFMAMITADIPINVPRWCGHNLSACQVFRI